MSDADDNLVLPHDIEGLIKAHTAFFWSSMALQVRAFHLNSSHQQVTQLLRRISDECWNEIEESQFQTSVMESKEFDVIREHMARIMKAASELDE